MIELEAGNPSAAGEPGVLGQLAKLPVVDEGFDDVLLDREIPVDDGGHGGPKLRHRGDGLWDAEVGDGISRAEPFTG